MSKIISSTERVDILQKYFDELLEAISYEFIRAANNRDFAIVRTRIAANRPCPTPNQIVGKEQIFRRGVSYFSIADIILILIRNIFDPGNWPPTNIVAVHQIIVNSRYCFEKILSKIRRYRN